jgi:transposase
MSRKYLPVNRDQPMLLPEDMRLWVEPDHFVWFLIDVIDGLDTTALQALGRPGTGRPGYDPRMLAVLLIYAYLQAERSSRKIEARCRTDAAFRIATGNLVPDHSAIARFRAAAAAAGGPLEDLFAEVLFVMAAAGLGRLDVISVDGSKIWANASKEANRTEEGLRKLARRILDEAARADGEECGCDGHAHGEAAGPDAEEACGCCDEGMLPGLGPDGPGVPRRGGAARRGRSGSRPGWRIWRRPGPGGSGNAARRRRSAWPRRGPGPRGPAGSRPGSPSRPRGCGWSRPSRRGRPRPPPGNGPRPAGARPAARGCPARARRSASPASSSMPLSPARRPRRGPPPRTARRRRSRDRCGT